MEEEGELGWGEKEEGWGGGYGENGRAALLGVAVVVGCGLHGLLLPV